MILDYQVFFQIVAPRCWLCQRRTLLLSPLLPACMWFCSWSEFSRNVISLLVCVCKIYGSVSIWLQLSSQYSGFLSSRQHCSCFSSSLSLRSCVLAGVNCVCDTCCICDFIVTFYHTWAAQFLSTNGMGSGNNEDFSIYCFHHKSLAYLTQCGCGLSFTSLILLSAS